MAEERCTWFEDNWTNEQGKSKEPYHKPHCPYSDRYLVKGTNRCIFHLEKINKQQEAAFIKELDIVLNESSYTWKYSSSSLEYLDLFGFIFPDDFWLSAILNNYDYRLPLCLNAAKLIGVHLEQSNIQSYFFEYAIMNNAQFNFSKMHGVSLRNASLVGASFLGSEIHASDLRDANLTGSSFINAKAYGLLAKGSKFIATNLTRCEMQGSDFTYADLRGSDFSYSIISGINFNYARLEGVTFKETDLSGRAAFIPDPNNEWPREFNTSNCKLKHTGTIQSAILRNSKLNNSRITIKVNSKPLNSNDNKIINVIKKHACYNTLDISETDNSIKIYLSPAIFNNANLEGVDLSCCNIAGTYFNRSSLNATVFRAVKFGKKKTKNNWDCKWHHKNRWSDASKADEREDWPELPIFEGANVEASDWADNREAQRDFVYAEYVRQFREKHPKIAWLWRLTCDYGRSLWRWALIALILAALFGGAYAIFDLLENTETVWESFYFSIVAFTTLGFGDITPACTTGQILAAIEVIFGYIMLGGLISIFAVKVARRD